MSSDKNRAAVSQAVAAFNKPSDRNRYFDLYAPDCVLHGFPPGLAPGIAGIKQFITGFWTAFPDSQLTADDMVGEGDRLALRYTIRGSHKGEFLGVQPTGRTVTVSGMTFLRFSDGKCVERWNVADMAGLLQQLGPVPAQV